jgi:hypothetical protein
MSGGGPQFLSPRAVPGFGPFHLWAVDLGIGYPHRHPGYEGTWSLGFHVPLAPTTGHPCRRFMRGL